MPQWVQALISSDLFMPHGHCYLWKPGLVWLHVVSDGLIWASYVAISATLAYLVHRVGDIPFKWVFFAFGIFIVSCGFTHFFEVWTVWNPIYWISGGVKSLTAIASVGTAVLMPPLVPKAVALARSARVAREKGIQLETAYKDLGNLYEKTRELERAKTDFFANVSHELRTPLTLILWPTEKLLAGPLPDGERRDLEVVARNARLLIRQVNDLLDLSKLESGKMTVEYRRADLTALVRQVAAHFESLAHERQIELVMEAPGEVPMDLDVEKVHRVVLNLFSNAFKFTPAGGRVRCAIVRRDPTRVAIEVADSGPGVAPEMRRAIFERFRQGDGGAARRFGGTGLGLAIARDFVLLHAGSISVGDAPEGGACFVVELPLEAPAGAIRAAVAEEGEAEGVQARQAIEQLRERVEAVATSGFEEKPLVLVVEDNPEMNRFIRESLEPDYRTAAAFDGGQGLERARALSPDLILSDVMMPLVSGETLVSQLRAQREFDGTPIVLLTARADRESRVRLLGAGAQDYLMKPFSIPELRARVENLVTIKRARTVLQTELASQARDLESLAGEVVTRRRELETALEAMRAAREQAERASQVKTNFLGLVSHELRSPLAVIQLQLELLSRDPEVPFTGQQREAIERVRRSSQRLSDLIESLLEHARIESGRIALSVEQFDPSLLAAEVAAELAPQAETKGLALRVSAPSVRQEIETDPRLLRLILVNLVGNAIKYTQQGFVALTVELGGREARFRVQDTGPGIPDGERDQVFEPFTRLDSAHLRHTPGVGLGLALVRQMTHALGGRIELESMTGAGSTFTIVLPEKPAATGQLVQY
jgi:signal transduction histidine kinase